MENRLDKLFRDKLSSNEGIPSPQAWEQIHRQLVSKRRGLWGQRLAIAASILLFATMGFVGYRYLNSLTLKKDQMVARSIEEDQKNEQKVIENQITGNNENETSESQKTESDIKLNDHQVADAVAKNEIPEDKKTASNIVSNAYPAVIAEAKSAGKDAEVPSKDESPFIEHEEKNLLIAEAEWDKKEAQEKVKIEQQEIVGRDSELPEQRVEALLAENKAIAKSHEIQEIEDQKKSYPQVKIIYKANKDSELLASGKKSIFDKGIHKITEFSDEHLLTEERKTKLRNTKEDLLALNFGKLLNKSNKEFEN